jgi:hypothetical protein
MTIAGVGAIRQPGGPFLRLERALPGLPAGTGQVIVTDAPERGMAWAEF